MMKFLFYSKTGDSLPLALRCFIEGNDVILYLKEEKQGYEGLLPKTDNWRKYISQDRVVVFDMVRNGVLADYLRRLKYPVFGAGKLCDNLELDRVYGTKVMQAVGIKTPETWQFNSFEKAKDFVKGKKELFVFKPSDNKAPAYTYSATSSEDMIGMLDYFKGIWKGKVNFELQRYINGIEISIEGWWTGENFAGLNSTFEDKKFLTGDLGCNVGSSSSVVFAYRDKSPRLYQLTLKKMELFLKKMDYPPCPLDINCIISEKDHTAYGLEFSARMGYNAIFALSELLKEDIGKVLSDFTMGQGDLNLNSEAFSGALRVSIPPYPASEEKEVIKIKGIPIGIDLENRHIHPLDVLFDKEDNLVCAGSDGIICEVSGKAKTIDGLARDIYNIADTLEIPNKQYRTDLGIRARKDLVTLKEWRYS